MKNLIRLFGKSITVGIGLSVGILIVYATTTISGLGQKTIESGDKIGTGWFNEVDDNIISLTQNKAEKSSVDTLSGNVNKILIGTNQNNPGQSCKDILDKNPLSQGSDGKYWIDPDGSGGESTFEVYCDMTTDGGGWIRLSFSFSNYEDLANNEFPIVGTDISTISNILNTNISFSEIKGKYRFVLGGSLDKETIGWYLGGNKLKEGAWDVNSNGCPSNWINKSEWNNIASYNKFCYKDENVYISNFNDNSINFDFSFIGCSQATSTCEQDYTNEYFGGKFIDNYIYVR